MYLGQWRVTAIVEGLIVLGGDAFDEEKEITGQRLRLRLWMSREQSLLLLMLCGCTRHHP